MSSTGSATLARAYIEAVGRRDLAELDSLFSDQLVATFVGTNSTKSEWIRALHRLLPVLERNNILEVFDNGDRACVVYDFVTTTPAGAVRCVELVTAEGGVITAIELLLDRVAFAPVNAALQERAGADRSPTLGGHS